MIANRSNVALFLWIESQKWLTLEKVVTLGTKKEVTMKHRTRKERVFNEATGWYETREVELKSYSFTVYHSQSKSKKSGKFMIFSVFSFGCLGGILYLCIDFVTCWLSDTYIWICNMFATSKANALIVSIFRFRGGNLSLIIVRC